MLLPDGRAAYLRELFTKLTVKNVHTIHLYEMQLDFCLDRINTKALSSVGCRESRLIFGSRSSTVQNQHRNGRIHIKSNRNEFVSAT